MKSLPLFLFFLTLVNTSQEEEIKSKIVGGVVVQEGRYPYQVSLTNGCRNMCGGALIAPNYVVSAAHCRNIFTEVQIGRHDFSDSRENFETFHAIDKVRHPKYSSLKVSNDIMLIKLNGSSRYATIKLDNYTENLSEGADVSVIGWGKTSNDGRFSDKLKEVEVDIVDHEKCQASYDSHNISKDMLCAAREGKDACQGDSGGPLIKKGSDASNDVLVGIVSWGLGCALPNHPGVYVNVSYFHEWIQSTMNSSMNQTSKNFSTIISQVISLFNAIS